jgi:hypothetical protein
MQQFQDDVFGKKGQDKIQEFHNTCVEYRELWRAGKAGSPEMKALLARLRDWWGAEGLLSLDDPKLQAALDNPCMKKLLVELPDLDCDPDVQAIVGAILGVPALPRFLDTAPTPAQIKLIKDFDPVLFFQGSGPRRSRAVRAAARTS